MASLELLLSDTKNASAPLEEKDQSVDLATGSMQRKSGRTIMGRGQQREQSSTDDVRTSPQPGRVVSITTAAATTSGGATSRVGNIRVLVRSHAMREATSPPREPVIDNPQTRTSPPCINLIPSPSPSSSPVLLPSFEAAPAEQEQNQEQEQNGDHSNASTTSTATVVRKSPSPATVRTQDALTSAITRKLNGTMSPPLPLQSLLVTATNNSSSSSSNSDSSPVMSRHHHRYHHCNCISTMCTDCSKTSERNNNNSNANNNNSNSALLTVNRANCSVKHKFRQQNSSQGSLDGSSSTVSPCLTRDNSTEQYTDTTGVDLAQFIKETLNKNAKDRIMMLKIEQELVTLAKDKVKTHYKFPPMSSYQRMLVHRCAAYFGMDHNIEMSGKCVVVNKTNCTRIPEMRFRDHIRDEFLFPEEPRRSILKRDTSSFEDCNYKSPDSQYDNSRRSKSFEEREEEYEKVRSRIFKDGTEEFLWADIGWSPNDCSKMQLLPPEQQFKQNRFLKVQSVETKTDQGHRPYVAKSYSFGGYGGVGASVLSRGDSMTSTHSAGARLFTKQDSATSTSTISWRLSPSSSGYKSQSQRSDSITPSPSATPHQLSDASGEISFPEAVDSIHESITEETVEQAQQTDEELVPLKPLLPKSETTTNQLVWAVTDMHSIPKGSVLINPQTGQPFTNDDGTIYHFDLLNPPPGFTSTNRASSSVVATSPQKSVVKESPKKPSKHKPSIAKYSYKSTPSYLINSSTSPSLPLTPPHHHFGIIPAATAMENPTNLPSYVASASAYQTIPPPAFMVPPPPPHLQPHTSLQPNTESTTMHMFQPPLTMMYSNQNQSPYDMAGGPYENRTDPVLNDLPGYFLNMSVSEPPPPPQSVGFQTYWGQQPITYYQPNSQPNQQQPPPILQQQQQQQSQQQRYPIQLPLPAPNQNYLPLMTGNPPPNPDVISFLPSQMQLMYAQTQQYAQNPNGVVFGPNGVYRPNSLYSTTTTTSVYPPAVPTPQHFPHANSNINQTYRSNNITTPKNHYQSTNNGNKKNCASYASTHSSSGTNSPANTVIASGSFYSSYRQPQSLTPPDTPPNPNIVASNFTGYHTCGNFGPQMQTQSMFFRPLNSSRSPTPASEFMPQQALETATINRNQGYVMAAAPPIASTIYHGIPCLLPNDVRLIPNRNQPHVPGYQRQNYRPQNSDTNTAASTLARQNKFRKYRNKVPVILPTTINRQSSEDIQNGHM